MRKGGGCLARSLSSAEHVVGVGVGERVGVESGGGIAADMV